MLVNTPAHPNLDLYVWLVQHDGLLSLVVVQGLLVHGKGCELDQPVGGDHRSIKVILQSEGQAPFWKRNPTYISYTFKRSLQQSQRTSV